MFIIEFPEFSETQIGKTRKYECFFVLMDHRNQPFIEI